MLVVVNNLRSLYKFEGLGNDFLVTFIDSNNDLPDDISKRVVSLLDRRHGVGADGLIVGFVDESSRLNMRLFNADGSEAEISGNGIRCLAHASRKFAILNDDHFDISTKGGVRSISVLGDPKDTRCEFSVSMGEVSVVGEVFSRSYSFLGVDWMGTVLNVGNPHLVLVPKLESTGSISRSGVSKEIFHNLDIQRYGLDLQGEFDGGINVEWLNLAQIGDTLSDFVDMRVFERGVGVTLACGSGSTASAYLLISQGMVQNPVEVINPGGRVGVFYDEKSGETILNGESNFIGTIETSHEVFSL
ncbi:diaminopimelate epimerase [Acidithrix sp. C25]|uniref:diaminopimelate epimerase n=1 Tax=Acidithrix sp. C25 TaxID=1671482 RepID=UPI001BD193AC|nr:diaminopimelate epimerase [Acidithrix sp. C25]